MTDEQVLAEAKAWRNRAALLLDSTKDKDHVKKHLKLLDRLIAIAEDDNN